MIGEFGRGNRQRRASGALWASGIGASLVYTKSRTPLKPSLRLIHARMHAQALTLAVLSGAAVYHYYEKEKKGVADRTKVSASAVPGK
ncbi:hypothetical protein SDJN03_07828, partial [Cucurbita argyrosperma subsp. sororia]